MLVADCPVSDFRRHTVIGNRWETNVMCSFLVCPILRWGSGTALGVVDIRQNLGFLSFNSSRLMEHRGASKVSVCRHPPSMAVARASLVGVQHCCTPAWQESDQLRLFP